jgi:hypothetical protein
LALARRLHLSQCVAPAAPRSAARPTQGGVPMNDKITPTDITAQEPPSTLLMERIRDGMKVVDAAGDEVGKVAYIKMGDPDAATVDEASVDDRPGLIADIGEALTVTGTEPDVPDPLRSQLLREGFVRIDAKGWFTGDRYVAASQIAGVSSDTVRLTVTKDALAKES